MRIYIEYYFKDSAFGGANQFLKALRDYCLKRGVYAETIDDADIVLFNSMIPYAKIYMLKHKYPDKIFVHRVDGPCKLYNDMSDKRDDMVYALNQRVADATIFQSEYVKNVSIQMGCPRQAYEAVIYNGCDYSLFYRKSRNNALNNRRIRLVATSFSDNWNKGFKSYQWLDNNLDYDRYEMTFIGRTPCEFEHIKTVPPMPSKELAEILRNQDIYITASISDPCSNSLIEAMSCGLPVLALNSGGHPELIKNGGLLFDNVEEIPNVLEIIVDDYEAFSKNVTGISIEEVGREYLEFFSSLISEKKQGSIRKKKVHLYDVILSFCGDRIGKTWIP